MKLARRHVIAAVLLSALAAGDCRAAGVVVDLDADTNRDGYVTGDDESGEDSASPARGALFLANCDRDGGERLDAAAFADDGTAAYESEAVASDADAADLAPVVVRASNAAQDLRWWLEMSRDDARAVHVFAARRKGARLLFGGARSAGNGPTVRVRIDELVTAGADVELGIESLALPGHMLESGGETWTFDGQVDLSLVAEAPSGERVASDRVRLHVAPLLFQPGTEPAQKIWIQLNAGSAALADAFGGKAEVVEQSAQEAGVHRYLQDQVEIGYSAMPRAGSRAMQAMHVALQMPVPPPAAWLEREMPAPGRGLYRSKLPERSTTSDMGGNLELLPPTSEWPLGRVLMGRGASGELLSFLSAQAIAGAPLQPAVLVDAGWLRVGHVDELVSFLPAPKGRAGRPFKVVIADPAYAMKLLREGDASRGIAPPAIDSAAFVLGPQESGRASNAFATDSAVLLFDGVAHGSIRCPSAAGLRDGETVTIGDGRKTRTFEFDFDGTTAAPNVPVRIRDGQVAADVSRRLRRAIVRSLGLVVALREADGTFVLANREFGVAANQPITETVAGDGFVVRGMAGGEPASEGRDFTQGDWRIVRIFDGTGTGQVAAVSQRHKGFFSVFALNRRNSVFRTESVVSDDRMPDRLTLQHLLYGELEGDEYSDRWMIEPAADSRYVIATEALTWHTRGATGAWGFPTMTTMSELRGDESLAAFNREAQRRIDGVRAAIVEAAGKDERGLPFLRDDGNAGDDALDGDPDDDFVRLPVLFTGRILADGSIGPGSGEALAPNLVNFQAADVRHIVLPRTHFGPAVDVSGHDLFEWPARLAIGEHARFLDEWTTYHDGIGEVHCATAAERELPAYPWWTRIPRHPSLNDR